MALARISRATGLNVVMGSGYYIDLVHPDDMNERSESQIAEETVEELSAGVAGTRVRPGIIGELECSWPLTPNERKVLRSGARSQRESGASITVHPGRDETAPFEVLDVLENAGADLSRVIICHLDRTISDVDTLLKLARRGCNLEYDFFGWEISNFSLSEFAVRKGHAQRRPAPGLYRGADGRRLRRAYSHRSRHVRQAPAGAVRGPRVRPYYGEHRPTDAAAGLFGHRRRGDHRGEPGADIDVGVR